ncbi:hypothetical protein KGA66_03315, partial [Actinocrinis puniceicyclus]
MSADSAIGLPGSSMPQAGAAGLEAERRARLRDAVLAGPAAVSARALDQAQRAGLLARLVAAGD